jgi:hypothetical protein
MSVHRRGRVVSVLVAAAILSFGGLRQAPVPAQASTHVSTATQTRIGTACVMDRGGPQICR